MLRAISVLSVLVIVFCMTGCANTFSSYPALKHSNLLPSVVLARPVSGRYLKNFSWCLNQEPDENGLITICMDPPPQAIKYSIEQQLYGTRLPRNIEVATTSHYGLESVDFNKSELQLILIGSQNNAYILPRYHRLLVAQISSGSYAVPIYEQGDFWWFPCNVAKKIKPLMFKDAVNTVGVPVEDGYDVFEDTNYLNLIDGVYIPTHGITIDDLIQYLSDEAPLIEEFECEN